MVQLNNITSLHNNCVHQRQRRLTRNSHVFIFLEKTKKKNNIENSIAHSEFFRCNDTQQSINQRHGTGRYIQTLQLLADVSGSDAWCSRKLLQLTDSQWCNCKLQLQINIQMRNKSLVLRLIPMILLHLNQKSLELAHNIIEVEGTSCLVLVPSTS